LSRPRIPVLYPFFLSVLDNIRPLPLISYPDSLPVSAQRERIAAAIARHQVVVVCGETGSGKTTQLPKICLELGRGRSGKNGGKGGGMIGHTQPRRLAATSVARRIAQEMQTELGDWVGYQIRFQERASASTAIKLMTDGILLAESQRDPLLRRYDTLIIDEAHERSLNIDFLLGFLRQLLPRRPDLKLIITSASMDAAKLAAHFRLPQGQDVPVIEVSGRSFPIALRYRPVVQDKPQDKPQEKSGLKSEPKSDPDIERDLMDAVVDAVQECTQHGAGDVLVFLPGEREIREAAQALSEHARLGEQILPLFARLTQAEQERIFRPQGQARRIVLATNVAETSLTVPGIRYVVDSGLARVKRYSWRQKVEQLRIEPISQASAKQRAGRCGRLGPGLCIRLYDEADFARRPEYTDPEILRSSLAAVILRMKALGLDDVEVFPFVDAPSGRAIADGYQQLQELGALDEHNRLSKIGRMLARLPIDPRLARMVLAARDQQCLTEVLIIASALSVQDPRQQPLQAREAAGQAHRRFFNMQDSYSGEQDKSKGKSEFLSYVHLWRWLNTQCDGLSQRKQAALMKQHYLSPSRVREWRDVHQQLRAIVQEHRWQPNATPATFEQIHVALLAGLLGNIGLKNEQGKEPGGGGLGTYLGTRDIRFQIHPASFLARRAGRWVLAADLAQTSRLYARCIASIEPQWIEQAAGGLLKKSWSDPRWQRKAGQVVANERATLYGLTVYQGRRVHYGKIEPKEAREIFIRDGLVAGDIDTRLDFIAHNLKLAAQIEKLEHQTRRPDILVDDSLIMAFYDQHLPADICQTATLEKWAAGLDNAQRTSLFLTRDDLMRHQASGVTTDVFPRLLRRQGAELALDYHFEPGSPKDGVTLTVPLFVLGALQAWPFEWLVPGMLKEKVQVLLKSLPQKIRRHCVPLPDYAAGFFERWFEQAMDPPIPLLDALAQDLWAQVKVRPQLSDFKVEALPAHLFMNFKIVDEHGRMLSGGRNLDALKAEHAPQAQASFQQIVAKDARLQHVLAHDRITGWSFGELPELMEVRRGGQSVIGYPALIDKANHCELDVFDDPELARSHHRRGLLRLFRLALNEQVKYLNKNLPELTRMGMLYMGLGTLENLRDQIVDVALMQACLAEPWPKNREEFTRRCQQSRTRLGLLAQEAARLTLQILTAWQAAQKKLAQAKAFEASHKDMQAQLSALMPAQFLTQTPGAQLAHFPRYLQAVQNRIEKLRVDPARDSKLMAEMSALLAQYHRARAALKGGRNDALDSYRWLIEELRVALFAQTLRTPMPVSVKRLQKAWEALQR